MKRSAWLLCLLGVSLERKGRVQSTGSPGDNMLMYTCIERMCRPCGRISNPCSEGTLLFSNASSCVERSLCDTSADTSKTYFQCDYPEDYAADCSSMRFGCSWLICEVGFRFCSLGRYVHVYKGQTDLANVTSVCRGKQVPHGFSFYGSNDYYYQPDESSACVRCYTPNCPTGVMYFTMKACTRAASHRTHRFDDKSQRLAIIEAIDAADSDRLDSILQNDLNVNGTLLDDGSSVIHYAINRDDPDLDVIMTLLRSSHKSTDLAGIDAEGESILIRAIKSVKRNQLVIVASIVAHIQTYNPDLLNQRTGNHSYSALHIAVKLGLDKMVKLLLDGGAAVDITDNVGNTPLMILIAVRPSNMQQILTLLLRSGADPKLRNLEDSSPLLSAVGQLEYDFLETMFRESENLSIADETGRSAMDLLTAFGDPDVGLVYKVQRIGSFLIRLGIEPPNNASRLLYFIDKPMETEDLFDIIRSADNIDARIADGKTALMLTKSYRVAQFLIDNGADVNATDRDGYTALHYYLERPEPELGAFKDIVTVVIRNGADINAATFTNGYTPLHTVIGYWPEPSWRQWSMLSRFLGQRLRLLLESGANANATTAAGETALWLACNRYNIIAVRMLLQQQADPNAANSHGVTPLMAAAGSQSARRSKGKNGDLFDIILRSGAAINATDARHWTFFHHIASNCHASRNSLTVNAIKSLLGYQPDLNISDANGDTPLHLLLKRLVLPCTPSCFNVGDGVASASINEFAALLIEAGATVNLPTNNMSLLHTAVNGMMDNEELVRILLQNGARVDATDTDSETPLHYASKNGFTNSVTLLLRHGASPNNLNKHSQSPMMLAASSNMNSDKLVSILTQSNASVDLLDLQQRSALIYAINARNVDALWILLEESNHEDVGSIEASSPLHVVANMSGDEARMAMGLLQHDYDPNVALGEFDRTPLMLAVHKGNIEIVRQLLKYGANVMTEDANGNNALMYAAAAKHVSKDALTILLRSGNYSIEALSKCLVTAVRQQNHQIALTLLINGADPNYNFGEQGATIFVRESLPTVAAKNRDDRMIEILMTYGASLEYDGGRALRVLKHRSEGGDSLATTWLYPQPFEQGITYLGCFKAFYTIDVPLTKHIAPSQRTLFEYEETISVRGPLDNPVELCHRSCHRQSYRYMGLSASQRAGFYNSEANCLCGNNLTAIKLTPVSDGCVRPCPFSTSIACGGLDSFDVYATSSTTGETPVCPKGWEKFRAHCYRYEPKTETFLMAERTCSSYGAHLVSIRDKDENEFLARLTGTEAKGDQSAASIWLGLNKVLRKRSLHWTDGSRLSFHAFGIDRRDTNEMMDCTAMRNVPSNANQWFFTSCQQPYGYVCKTLGFESEDAYGLQSERFCDIEVARYVYISVAVFAAVLLIVAVCFIPGCCGHMLVSVLREKKKMYSGMTPVRKPFEAMTNAPAYYSRRLRRMESNSVQSRLEFKTFCEETGVQGFKELLTAQTMVTRVVWILAFLTFVGLMLKQTHDMIIQYNSEETATTLRSTVIHDLQDAVGTITICAPLFGGWAKGSFPKESCGRDIFSEFVALKELLIGYGSFDDPYFTEEYNRYLATAMSCLNVSTVSELWSMLWGIEPQDGVNLVGATFVTSNSGEDGPLICRTAKSSVCVAGIGCRFGFSIQIDYATFLRTRDRLQQSKSLKLYYSPYYSYDPLISSKLFDTRRALIPLPPLNATLSKEGANFDQIRYTRKRDNDIVVLSYSHGINVGVQLTKYIMAADKTDHCQPTPKRSVLPAWFSDSVCLRMGDAASNCEELLLQEFANCSIAAAYDLNLAKRFHLCNMYEEHPAWKQLVPACYQQKCLKRCPSMPYCESWIIKHTTTESAPLSGDDLVASKYLLSISPSDDVLEIEEHIIMTWTEFLSNIGGLWGLYLGCSFISLFHIVWFISDSLAARRSRKSLYRIICEEHCWNILQATMMPQGVTEKQSVESIETGSIADVDQSNSIYTTAGAFIAPNVENSNKSEHRHTQCPERTTSDTGQDNTYDTDRSSFPTVPSKDVIEAFQFIINASGSEDTARLQTLLAEALVQAARRIKADASTTTADDEVVAETDQTYETEEPKAQRQSSDDM